MQSNKLVGSSFHLLYYVGCPKHTGKENFKHDKCILDDHSTTMLCNLHCGKMDLIILRKGIAANQFT